MPGAWIRCRDLLPPQNEVVETKIDDRNGLRNERELKLRNNLWFLPDDSMYVYYAPTHWRRKERETDELQNSHQAPAGGFASKT